MSIGNTLRLIRSFQHLTQQQVADKAGLSRGLLGQLETGAVNPSVNSLTALAIAFDMKLSSIILLWELLNEGVSPESPQIQNLLIKRK